MVENRKIDTKALEALGIIDIDCIIVDKVFASCQQRECFPEVEVTLEEGKFGRVRFRPGFIVPNSLKVTDIEGQPDFRRVRFTVRIPYNILNPKGEVIAEDFLPDIYKDIVLYIPDARDEFDFRIVVETQSVVLAPPVQSGNTVTFPVGTFIIVKVVGTVQLMIPSFGYCPEPPECTEFSPADVCDAFENADFPDFFPPQLPRHP
ncbi:MAG: hypothetical protein GX185_04450 [Tissierellia bacterium]|nr:hypothetical protein [Tissierellia bacterium]